MSVFFPKTSSLSLFLAKQNDHDVWEVLYNISPTNGEVSWPVLEVNQQLPYTGQIAEFLKNECTGFNAINLSFDTDFSEFLSESNELRLLILAGQQVQDINSHWQWCIIPEFLRKLPKTRARLPFLKAWQILMGAHKNQLEAITVDDLRKSLLTH